MKFTINALSKRYGPVQALDGLSFQSNPTCSCVGVLGKNGAGKSTLLKILVGLLNADSGSIEIDINDRIYRNANARIAAYIPEDLCLLEHVKVQDFFKIIQEMNRLVAVDTDCELRDELIEVLDLGNTLERRITTLSKGNKRKVELIAACSARVELLVADELTTGIDVAGRIALEKVIRNTISKKRQLLISSHDLSFICSCCDGVVIIDEGKVVEQMFDRVPNEQLKKTIEKVFGAVREN